MYLLSKVPPTTIDYGSIGLSESREVQAAVIEFEACNGDDLV